LDFSSLWNDFSNVYPEAPIKYILSNKIAWASPLISQFGYFSVLFFFVLSGFLITISLLKEKIEKNKFSTSNFYFRRIIRIWPLYFIIIFSIFTLNKFDVQIISFPNTVNPNINEETLHLLYFLVSPNVLLMLGASIGSIGHLWSIGVEEHFYAFWPLMLNKIQRNGFLWIAIIYITIKIVIKIFLLPYFPQLLHLLSYLIINKFECMILGGWLAFVYHFEHQCNFKFPIRFINLLIYLNIVLIVLLTYLLSEFWSNFNYLFVCSLSILVIVKSSILSSNHVLNSRLFILLGNSSYAIYLTHFPVTIAFFNYIKLFKQEGEKIYLSPMENILSYSCVFMISILLGSFLYSFIESPIKKACIKR
jgi:peptidoglycan/LPS O-acetylase OafA/YrhL